MTPPIESPTPADFGTTHLKTQTVGVKTQTVGMKNWTVGILCVLVTTLAIGSAYLLGRNQSLQALIQGNRTHSVPDIKIDGQSFPLMDAASAVVSDKFSVATGPVSEDGDGFFMLDHNSGLLQCQVIYPRTGLIGATFQTNVGEALGTGGKGGDYLMLTGRVNFPRASNRPAGNCVVYVMDTTTGSFACFGVPFNNVMVNSNRPQQGAMVLIARGSANPLIDRDNFR